MARKETYKPLALDEQKASFRNDPDKLDMTDGSSDPVNKDAYRWLEDKYVPQYPKNTKSA